jgi:hypothetical protein
MQGKGCVNCHFLGVGGMRGRHVACHCFHHHDIIETQGPFVKWGRGEEKHPFVKFVNSHLRSKKMKFC